MRKQVEFDMTLTKRFKDPFEPTSQDPFEPTSQDPLEPTLQEYPQKIRLRARRQSFKEFLNILAIMDQQDLIHPGHPSPDTDDDLPSYNACMLSYCEP